MCRRSVSFPGCVYKTGKLTAAPDSKELPEQSDTPFQGSETSVGAERVHPSVHKEPAHLRIADLARLPERRDRAFDLTEACLNAGNIERRNESLTGPPLQFAQDMVGLSSISNDGVGMSEVRESAE